MSRRNTNYNEVETRTSTRYTLKLNGLPTGGQLFGANSVEMLSNGSSALNTVRADEGAGSFSIAGVASYCTFLRQ